MPLTNGSTFIPGGRLDALDRYAPGRFHLPATTPAATLGFTLLDLEAHGIDQVWLLPRRFVMLSREHTALVWDASSALSSSEHSNQIRHAFDLALLNLRREIREVEGMRGHGVVAYLMNPHVGWNSSLNARRAEAGEVKQPALRLVQAETL